MAMAVLVHGGATSTLGRAVVRQVQARLPAVRIVTELGEAAANKVDAAVIAAPVTAQAVEALRRLNLATVVDLAQYYSPVDGVKYCDLGGLGFVGELVVARYSDEFKGTVQSTSRACLALQDALVTHELPRILANRGNRGQLFKSLNAACRSWFVWVHDAHASSIGCMRRWVWRFVAPVLPYSVIHWYAARMCHASSTTIQCILHGAPSVVPNMCGVASGKESEPQDKHLSVTVYCGHLSLADVQATAATLALSAMCNPGVHVSGGSIPASQLLTLQQLAAHEHVRVLRNALDADAPEPFYTQKPEQRWFGTARRSASATFIQRALGEDCYNALPSFVRDFHDGHGTVQGKLAVTCSQPLVCKLGGLPSENSRGTATTVIASTTPGGVRWQRQFGSHAMSSLCKASHGVIAESFGPMTLYYQLLPTHPSAKDVGFEHIQLSASLFGVIPLPYWLSVQSHGITLAHHDGLGWYVRVRIWQPLLGHLVTYEGDVRQAQVGQST